MPRSLTKYLIAGIGLLTLGLGANEAYRWNEIKNDEQRISDLGIVSGDVISSGTFYALKYIRNDIKHHKSWSLLF